MKPIIISLPIRTVSEANNREHWRVKSQRAKQQRGWASAAVESMENKISRSAEHLQITLTRFGPRLMDGDNVVRSLKAVRDGVADAIGIDDGDAFYDWRYAQYKGEYGITIEIKSQ